MHDNPVNARGSSGIPNQSYEPSNPEPGVNAAVSPRLYNTDLAPAKERKWSSFSIFALWMNDIHNISFYAFAGSFFAIGLSVFNVVLALFVGISLVFVGMTLTGLIGQKTGVPFPVVSRISFGVFGAYIPALIRAVIAIMWYGIMTYLGSQAIVVVVLRVAPATLYLTKMSFLGLSALGWIAFLAMWLIQLVLLSYGMEVVRKVQNVGGPIIWILMLALAVWMLVLTHGHLSWTPPHPLSGWARVGATFGAIFLVVANFGALMLNFSDFSRFSPDRKSIIRGNLLGLPLNFTAFIMVSVVVMVGAYQLWGNLITNPVAILAHVHSPAILIFCAALFAFSTIGVNIVANFVSPAYDLSNVSPKHIDFKRGGAISATLALFMVPWKLYGSAIAIVYVNGAFGAFLGPIFGILMTDYWLIRRQRVNVPNLYTLNPRGDYYYRRGINPRALAALLPSWTVAIVLALIPYFGLASQFAWLVGAALSTLIYYFVSDRTKGYVEAGGDLIASSGSERHAALRMESGESATERSI